jgi:hypothetical protein
MAHYICSVCGESASSKCAASRNVFPRDQIATVVANFYTREIDEKGNLILHVKKEIFDAGITPEAKEMQFFNIIRDVPEESLKHLVCDHRWVLQNETCDLECCKK